MKKTDTERLEALRLKRLRKRQRREKRHRQWLERHPDAERTKLACSPAQRDTRDRRGYRPPRKDT